MMRSVRGVGGVGVSIGDVEWRGSVVFLSMISLLQLFSLQKGMGMLRQKCKGRLPIKTKRNSTKENVDDKAQNLEGFNLRDDIIYVIIDPKPVKIVVSPKSKDEVERNQSHIYWYICCRAFQMLLSIIVFILMVSSQTYQELKSIDKSYPKIATHCFINCRRISIAADCFVTLSIIYFMCITSLLILLIHVFNGGKLVTITTCIQVQHFSNIPGLLITFFNMALVCFAFGDVTWKISVAGTILLLGTHIFTLRNELQVDDGHNNSSMETTEAINAKIQRKKFTSSRGASFGKSQNTLRGSFST